MIYHILEVANTHGGNIDYLESLIDEFSVFDKCGMKFQVFHPDRISTKDYEGYPIYTELYFKQDEWKRIIKRASQSKDIWLDLFDLYSLEILAENKSLVKGVKLQSSVLYNEELLFSLTKQKLHQLILVVNVSGYDIDNITERIQLIEKTLEPAEIWIEVGFQAYPTTLSDSGFAKIQAIKNHFPNKVVFADHADAKSDDALWLPLIASLFGADVIEKHICHSSRETKYDYFSGIDVHVFKKYLSCLENYHELKTMPFINQKEKDYLSNSIQIPICKAPLREGQTVSLTEDLAYRRSGKKGLNTLQIKEVNGNYSVMNNNKSVDDHLVKEDFRKAKIATIIACRLKSSRLPKKALLKIGELPSVERCIKSCLTFKNIDYTILATSTLPEDDELANNTFRRDVIFHRGDPDDVIQRYLDIANDLNIDVIIRVTADCPYSSPEIAEYLLDEHFRYGADYTAAIGAALGTDTEIINTEALRRVKSYFRRADYSEYMTWYFQNNPDVFKLHIVQLPEQWVRGYRLTLDYQEDMDLFERIHGHLHKINPDYGFKEIIELLDSTELSKINEHITQRYIVDQELIKKLNEVTKIKVKQ